MTRTVLAVLLLCCACTREHKSPDCRDLPGSEDLRSLLKGAPLEGEAGGMASGKFEWAAVVNKQGQVCAVAVSTDDPAQAWPGSQAVALAKAFTANAFSTDQVPLSTARIYTMTQPGHSLWGIASANPFNPACLVTPEDHGAQVGKVCGGSIAFGGGVPLYKNGKKIGGLGASGDTSCADHEIARRMRHKGGLDPSGGQFEDDIQFTAEKGASVWSHPQCANTWHNGKQIPGGEAPATGY